MFGSPTDLATIVAAAVLAFGAGSAAVRARRSKVSGADAPEVDAGASGASEAGAGTERARPPGEG